MLYVSTCLVAFAVYLCLKNGSGMVGVCICLVLTLYVLLPGFSYGLDHYFANALVCAEFANLKIYVKGTSCVDPTHGDPMEYHGNISFFPFLLSMDFPWISH